MKLAEMHAAEPIAWRLHLQFSDLGFAHPDEAAVHFQLKPMGERWRLVDRDTAQRILVHLLKEDMVHSSERIPTDVAQAESAEFLSRFSSEARFYTNGQWEDGWTFTRWGTAFGPASQPATEATCDGGILALDTTSSGVLWLEDED